jgi:hypothetical protein
MSNYVQELSPEAIINNNLSNSKNRAPVLFQSLSLEVDCIPLLSNHCSLPTIQNRTPSGPPPSEVYKAARTIADRPTKPRKYPPASTEPAPEAGLAVELAAALEVLAAFEEEATTEIVAPFVEVEATTTAEEVTPTIVEFAGLEVVDERTLLAEVEATTATEELSEALEDWWVD